MAQDMATAVVRPWAAQLDPLGVLNLTFLPGLINLMLLVLDKGNGTCIKTMGVVSQSQQSSVFLAIRCVYNTCIDCLIKISSVFSCRYDETYSYAVCSGCSSSKGYRSISKHYLNPWNV